MPEYLSVEVYNRCCNGSLSSFLAASQNLLEQVGYVSKEVETYFTNEAQTGESWEAVVTGQEGV